MKIRIEASSATDPYARFHGLAVDQELNRDFWISQPEKLIEPILGSWSPFTYEATVAVNSYFIYGNSSIAEYPWDVKVYVDGVLKASGVVWRDQPLRVDIAPTPVLIWSVIPAALPIVVVGGMVISSELQRYVR